VDGGVIALAAADGKPLWQVNLTGSLRHGPIAVQDGDAWRVVLVIPENGILLCLDARDGREVWKSKPTNRTDGAPAGDGRLIAYGNCDAAVHFFDAVTGAHRGSVPVGHEAQMAGGVFLYEGRAYGGTRVGELVCADGGGLTLVWHVSVASGEAYVTPAVARGVAVVGTPAGNLAAFDAKTGAERWKVSLSNALSTVCVVDDAVFAAAGGRVLGVRLSDGGQFATLPVGDDIEGPACNNRVLAVADDGGNVMVITGE
jgi:outer membrane protein assembly factor BamB